MDAVIFDIDGTLVQSAKVDDDLYRQSVVEVLGSVRFRNSLSDYDRVTDSGVLLQILDDNGLGHVPDPTEAIRSRFIELLEAHVSHHGPFIEVPGAREFVASLRESEYHEVAIATGGWRTSAMLKLESAGFEVGGIPIATSDDHWERTGIMRHALTQLGAEFDSVTYYGDGVWDQEASSALGWQFVPIGPALNGMVAFPETAL